MKQIINSYFKNKAATNLSVKQATINDAFFVRRIFFQNKVALHSEDISLSEWKEILSVKDADEKHFIMCDDATPVGYMKINGLLSQKEAWISMLFVAKEYHRQGIGSFALSYAEGFVKLHNIKSLKIQTDVDNIPAINCYLKCGYQICDKGKKIRFSKEL